jgi:sulfur relay (sulfurtransferase) DsrC/TusE family protein
MSVKPFRESRDLSDAVELIGRRLYGETWTGLEYASQPRKSPEEITSERKPLEDELSAAETEIQQIDTATRKSIDAAENRRLAGLREKRETRMRHLHAALSLDHPLNDIVVDAYHSHVRWQIARETLLEAIRNRRLTVHDGRGRELNPGAWSHPKFRYYLDLSIVINPRVSGEPRRQAARIYTDQFKKWRETLVPMIAAKHEPTAKELVTEFLRQEFAAMKTGPRKTKLVLRQEARQKINGVSLLMFEHVWTAEAPAESRKAGAPRKAR